MSTIHNVIRNRLSSLAVSVALLIGSGLWCLAVGACYATSGFRDDWSATPLFRMLMVMVTPAICFGGGIILRDARKQSRFSRLEWCALAAAFFPVTLGTLLVVWVVRALFWMSGVGI